ncbi:MAG: MmcQ/YjbR family DNA-binding protein [Bacteroidia bacterium]|nr:MmcQ/YjbR family DNA-binding protein [Bacteroidia bacterium]
MNIEILRNYCLSLKGVTESFPFGEDTLVYKVMGKIFAITGLDNPTTVNLKCRPEYAIELREDYPEAIFPGYHMNKKHWNTVSIIDNLPDSFIFSLIDHSYELVIAGLPAKIREELKSL